MQDMKWSGSYWWLVFCVWCIVFCAGCLVGCDSEKETSPEYRSKEEIQLIPQPLELRIDGGYFTINRKTAIVANPKSSSEAKYLQHLMESVTNFKIDTFFHDNGPPLEGGKSIKLWIYSDSLKVNLMR